MAQPFAETSWHLPALLERAAERWPERPFLLSPQDISVTYAGALRRVEQVAGSLHTMGVGRGDRVMMVCANREELVLLALATLRLGAIFIILSPETKAEGFQRIVGQCEPKVIMLDAPSGGLHDARIPTRWIHVEEDFASLSGAAPGTAPPFRGIDQDPAFLVFTSGSTGTPRGVILSHDNVRFATAAIQARVKYVETDRIGVFLPMSFDYGLYQLFLAMEAGAAVFLGRPDMVGPEFVRTLAAKEITVLPGVPTLFSALIKLQSWRPVPLPGLRMATNTGDHLPAVHIERLQALFAGIRVFPMYGLTECKRISILLPEELKDKPGSVGRPLDGTEVFAVDASGEPLPPGSVGELVVRGRHLALGYWGAEEETAKRYRRVGPGRARTMFTGDLGVVDEEGYLYFHGRGDFLIKHRGHRMSPLEIEDVICKMPGIVAAGVVKHEADDKLHLFVEASDGLGEVAVTGWLGERLEQVKVPECVHFVAALPKTTNQKVDRKALRTLLLEGRQ